MALKTSELNKVSLYLKDLTARIKSEGIDDDSKITVQNMMSMVDDGDDDGEQEDDLPPKTRKQRGKIIKNAIKTISKLKEMVVKRRGSRYADDADREKLMRRYYLPCSPLGCNVCVKVKLSLEESMEHKVLNHTTHEFACDFAYCGCIYETEHEKNKHMQKH